MGRRERSDINSDNRKKNKLKEPLHICNEVLVLAERLKKKDTSEALYKIQLKINLSFANIKYFL